jgi:hypothetical protein
MTVVSVQQMWLGLSKLFLFQVGMANGMASK